MATLTDTMVDLLGVQADVGPAAEREDLVEEIRRGLPAASVTALSDRFGLQHDEVLGLIDLSRRTLTRRKDGRLPVAASDRLARLARVLAFALDVLGDRDRVERWLHAPNRALGGRVPLRCLDTDLGAEEVEAVLGRLDLGVVG